MKEYTGPMRICHRGLTQAAPENTLGAFQGAYEKGFEGFEIDLQKSKDGEIIIIHDKNLARLTIGNPETYSIHSVESMTWDELSAVKLPYANHTQPKNLPAHSEIEQLLHTPERLLGQETGRDYETMLKKDPRTASLMRFDDLIVWMKDNGIHMTVEVEVKTGGIVSKLFQKIQASGIADRFIVFSGNGQHIREIQKTAAQEGKPDGLRLGANICSLHDDEVKQRVSSMDLWEIGLNDFKFDETDVRWCADRGIRIFSNLGDYPKWWKRINEMGIAGFKTCYAEAYTEWWMENY